MSTYNEIKELSFIDALMFADANFEEVNQDWENEKSTFEDSEGVQVEFCGITNTFKKV